MQAGVHLYHSYELHSLKVATGEKEPPPGARTRGLRSNVEFLCVQSVYRIYVVLFFPVATTASSIPGSRAHAQAHASCPLSAPSHR